MERHLLCYIWLKLGFCSICINCQFQVDSNGQMKILSKIVFDFAPTGIIFVRQKGASTLEEVSHFQPVNLRYQCNVLNGIDFFIYMARGVSKVLHQHVKALKENIA